MNVAQRDTDNLLLIAPAAGVVSGVPIQIGQMLVLPQDSATVGLKFTGLSDFHILYEKAVETVAAGDDAYWAPTGGVGGVGCFTKTDTGALLRVGKFSEAQTDTAAPAWVVVDGSGAATLNTADIATVATMAAAAGAAKKVLRSAGASRAVVADGPDYDKILTAVVPTAAGNLPVLGATGFPVDSTISIDDMAQRSMIETKNVTIALGAAAGSSAADPDWVGAQIIGHAPVSNNDQPIKSIAVAGDGVVTVTAAANETAEAVIAVTALLAQPV